jgi:hypothetical protein
MFAARFLRIPEENRVIFHLDLMAKASKAAKYVYLFGNKKADGDGSIPNVYAD